MNCNRTLIGFLLLTALVWQSVPAAQLTGEPYQAGSGDNYLELLRAAHGDEFPVLLEKIFGGEAEAAAAVFEEGSGPLLRSVTVTADQRAAELQDQEIAERKEKSRIVPTAEPATKPVRTPGKKAVPRRLGFSDSPRLDWRRLAFGFRPLSREDEKPDVKLTETKNEIKAEGTDKKSFETKEAKGTRTQKAETRYIRDGKTFGVEIKDTQVIEAVSKPDGKSFRRELSLLWGADVAACPDASGVSAGTGKAKIFSKTIYVENGVTVTMTSEFDLQAKLVGHVSDEAVMTHYDLQIDAYTTNSGYEDALQRGVIKEIKIRDGRYGLRYDIPGNTIEISDGKYGGSRTPAKMGEATARKLTPMSDAETTLIGKAIGPMVPSIWNSANEMYKSAEKNWKNGGCVEVACKVPKTLLKDGEAAAVSAETVHLQDKTRVNARLNAEGFGGQVIPDSQHAAPAAKFTFTQEGESDSGLEIKSVSKRGIGEAYIEFKVKKEDETGPGVWTGTVTAERTHREEREKRSGANLAENGGWISTTTKVRLQLTGRLDRTVDATNAHIANVTGTQETVDHEYDRYKIDEGYCGPNAVPYKGPKEITRTSTTTASYNRETRAYVEAGGTGGSITFSLPDINGTTVHKYVHTSPCAEHDRANTSDTVDEETPTAGGSFAFSFPIDPTQKTIKGSITIREEDGSTTTYSWELTKA